MREIKKKNITITIFISLIICFFAIAVLVTGCPPSDRESEETAETQFDGKPQPIVQIDIPEINQPLVKSERLDTKIFFDFTPSMAGFIDEGRPSIYMQTMLMLEKISLNCWPDSEILFFKFGNTLKELIGRKEYLNINTKDFYKLVKKNQDDNNNDNQEEIYENAKTKIDLALDHTDTNDLNIIVTDLFQDEQDLSVLVKEINSKFLSKGLAVGVIGIKSEFNGIIYDFGIKNNLRVVYDSGYEDPARFRPFYIILLGQPPDVYSYYEELKNKIQDFAVYNFFISSPLFYPRPEVTSLANMSSIKESDLNSSGLVAQKELIDKEYENYIKQYGILKDSELDKEIHLKSPYFIAKYGNDYIEEDFEINTRALIFNVNDGSEYSEMLRTDFEGAFSFKQNFDSNSILLDISINPGSIPLNQLTLLEINTFLNDKKTNELPEWINQWTMTLEMMVEVLDDLNKGKNTVKELDYIIYNSEKFDGGRTMNLDLLLSNLNAKNSIDYKEQVAYFNFIFWKY